MFYKHFYSKVVTSLIYAKFYKGGLFNHPMAIKKGDFIEFDFIGRVKETNSIFDLTNEKDAKANDVHNPKTKYGPKVICVGEGHVVKGLDEALIGKDLKEYKIELEPENAFGKKDPKLMKIVSTNIFLKQKIRPFPGLQVNIDNMIGIIKTVSGGRTIVDFNHPLAGHPIVYEVKILKLVKEDKEKLSALLEPAKQLFQLDIDIHYKDGEVTIKSKLPELLEKGFKERIIELIPSIKKLTFVKQ